MTDICEIFDKLTPVKQDQVVVCVSLKDIAELGSSKVILRYARDFLSSTSKSRHPVVGIVDSRSLFEALIVVIDSVSSSSWFRIVVTAIEERAGILWLVASGNLATIS